MWEGGDVCRCELESTDLKDEQQTDKLYILNLNTFKVKYLK